MKFVGSDARAEAGQWTDRISAGNNLIYECVRSELQFASYLSAALICETRLTSFTARH